MHIILVIILIIILLFIAFMNKFYPSINWAAKTNFKYYVLINILAFTNILTLIIMILKDVINFLMDK